MKITKVIYFRTYPHPVNGQWEKIGVEADLQVEDDARKALYECKKTVNDFFFESNKAAEKEQIKEVPLEPQTKIGMFIADIYSCKDLKVLESYKLLVKNNPELQAAYDQQFKKLTNV